MGKKPDLTGITERFPLRDAFLDAMSRVAATVNVVTTDGPVGRAGVTVTAMSSVSADTPAPTLLVCIHHLSAAAAAIHENGVFCVKGLERAQVHISDAFAGRCGADKVSSGNWKLMTTGAPRLANPLVAFDCRLQSSRLVGTHHVLFGAVEDVYISGAGSALVYVERRYGIAHSLTPGVSSAA